MSWGSHDIPWTCKTLTKLPSISSVWISAWWEAKDSFSTWLEQKIYQTCEKQSILPVQEIRNPNHSVNFPGNQSALVLAEIKASDTTDSVQPVEKQKIGLFEVGYTAYF